MLKISYLSSFYFLFIFLNINPLFSQSKKTYSEMKQYKWNISHTIGTCSSGPAKDIERAMINSNFNQTTTFFSARTRYPFSNTGFGAIGFPWSFSATYSFSGFYDVGLLISNINIGSTLGNQSDFKSLHIRYSVFTISPILYFNLFDLLKLGVGPALFMNLAKQDVNDKINTINQFNKFGILLDIKFVISTTTKFFAEIDVQYRPIGKLIIGKFETHEYYSSQGIATLPAFNANYSHYYFGVGMGVRFSKNK